MDEYYVDLHVHIGRSSGGKGIKMCTSNDLTFENVAYESFYRKGINVIGCVDCISPYVLEDIDKLVAMGDLVELKDGGMEYRGGQTLLLGAEIETHELGGCSAHSLCFFPTLKQIKDFSAEMKKYIKNIRTCSSMSRLNGQGLFDVVDAFGGIFIPAHVFTPHKSFYGNCCDSMTEIFNDESFEKIPAVELGLSADSMMASKLSELDGKSFISNSDAHSLRKIGREYNIFMIERPSYTEIVKALIGIDGRGIKANYGLNPLLGKYHRTYCLICKTIINGDPPILSCPVSKKHSVNVGVRDRFEIISDRKEPEMGDRPPYNYQIPLEFLPKLGPKTIDKLIVHFGNEMSVLHDASFEELCKVVKADTAKNIILARKGDLEIEVGGGGVYGKIETE
jgi:uncharacterized protein (TIGR00375 family)